MGKEYSGVAWSGSRGKLTKIHLLVAPSDRYTGCGLGIGWGHVAPHDVEEITCTTCQREYTRRLEADLIARKEYV